MATYFFATAGSDSNNGTSALTPFATFLKAVSVAIAGDTLLGNGGDTFTESVTIAVALASISSYGTGLATIISTALTNNTITMTAVPTSITNLNIQGITSVYANTGNHGIRIGTTGTAVVNGCTISGCNFSNIPNNGVVFAHATADNGGVTGISINNNTFNNIGGIGLQLTNSTGFVSNNYNYSNVSVNNNIFSNILGNTSTSGFSGGIGIIFQCVNTIAGPSVIHNNIFHDLGANCNPVQHGGGNGFQFEGCDGIQGYNNIVYNAFNTNTGTGDGGNALDIDLNNVNCSIYNNYVFNCDGPGLSCYSSGGTFTGNIFHHNICVNVARLTTLGGIFISGTSPYVFYNNTIICYGSNPCVATVQSLTPTSKLLNNIFVAPAGISTVVLSTGTVITSMTMDGNYHQSGFGLFASTLANGTQDILFSDWKTATGFEVSGVASSASSLYMSQPFPIPATMAGVAAYAPSISSSPVFNAGANLSGTYGITPAADFFGNPWTQNTIGAIYVPGSVTPYANALYPLNPRSHWRGSEGSGTVAFDSVPEFESGTYSSVNLGGTGIVPGDPGNSSVYDGASSSMTGVLTPRTFTNSGLTVVAWINPTVVNIASQTIASSWDNANTRSNFTLRLLNAALSLAIIDSSGQAAAGQLNGVSLTAGVPVQVVGVWSGTNTIALYINGASQTVTMTVSNSPANSSFKQPTIGFLDPASPQKWFEGSIQDVSIWTVALTAPQIATLYNAGTFAPGTATLGTVLATSIAASSTDASGGTTSYSYQWQQSTNGIVFTNSTGTGVTTKSATITGLSLATTYYLRLKFTDSASTPAVGYSNVITSTTEGTLVAGTATTGTVGPTSVVVVSTSPTGGGTPYTYQWQQSLDGSTYISASGTGVTTLSATINGLTINTNYFIRLQITDTNSTVVYTNVLNITTNHTAVLAAVLSGPTAGFLNKGSVYSISLNGQYTGVIVPFDSSNSGTFSPLFLSWNNTSQSQSFIYTPSANGNRSISITSSPSVAISGSPIPLSVQTATSLVLTGPPYVDYLGGIKGTIGSPSANFTVTPNGNFTGTVTMSDASVAQGCVSGGTFTPSSLTFNSSSAPQTFTYTPNSHGPRIISIDSHPGVTRNSGLRLIV